MYSSIVISIGFIAGGLPYWCGVDQSIYMIFLTNVHYGCFSCGIALYWGLIDAEAKLVQHVTWDLWVFFSVGLAGWWILVELVI